MLEGLDYAWQLIVDKKKKSLLRPKRSKLAIRKRLKKLIFALITPYIHKKVMNPTRKIKLQRINKIMDQYFDDIMKRDLN